jgi:hypothetical protein
MPSLTIPLKYYAASDICQSLLRHADPKLDQSLSVNLLANPPIKQESLAKTCKSGRADEEVVSKCMGDEGDKHHTRLCQSGHGSKCYRRYPSQVANTDSFSSRASGILPVPINFEVFGSETKFRWSSLPTSIYSGGWSISPAIKALGAASKTRRQACVQKKTRLP